MLEWPLIGREAELHRLVAAADDPSVAGVSIVGDAGVGKTRLASEVLGVLTARGRNSAWISASSSARAIPYGALAQILTIPWGPADEPGLHALLLGALDRRRNETGPLVLVVDDAHLLDEHSAAFAHLVIVRRAATVILTARTREPPPSALTQAWKDGRLHRAELTSLSRGDTGRLVETILGGEVESLTKLDLWRRSAGNALYLRELLMGALEAGTLVREDVGWRSIGADPPSTRLSELVRDRLGRLNRVQRRLVEILAIAGRTDLVLIESLGRGGSLEELEERRLVTVEQSGNRRFVRLAHPVYGEVVTADVPRSRARLFMRELADALEASGTRRREDALRLALWRLDGGGAPDAELLLEAAEEALASFDPKLGERLARAALGARGGLRAGLLLGRSLTAQQRVADADDVLAEAAHQAATDDEIAQVSLARADLLYFRGGRPAEAAAVLVEAIGLVRDPDWRDELEALLVLFRAGAGQLLPITEAGRRIAARAGARPRAVVHTLVYSTIANVMLGRFEEAAGQIEIGLAIAPDVRSELPLGAPMLAINRVMANAYAGELARALELGSEGLGAALDSGNADVVAMWSMNLAECRLLAGHAGIALGSILDSLRLVREADPFAVRAIAASLAAVCATWLGRLELARSLRQEVSDQELPMDVRSRIWFDRARVWGLAGDGDSLTAAHHAVEGATRAVAATHLVWGAWQLHDAVRLGHAELAAPMLSGLAEGIEGRMVPAMALHGMAQLEGDPVSLQSASSEFEQMGAMLFAAEAAAEAQRAFARHGRQRQSQVAGARASVLAARCEGVRTPALADTGPVPLTPRELDVARLAARGLPSRQLADRLGISVRTVDNHLGSVYGKLGIGGRVDLASVFGTVSDRPEAG